MTTLTQALSIEPGDCVAVVGAGGKTTLCWRLVQEIAASGGRAVFTTTTKIWRPADGVFDRLYVGPLPHPLPVGEGGWKSACLASAIEGATNTTPINGAGMPTVQTKLTGFTPDEVCALPRSTNYQLPITLLVEADGARGLRIKAPGNGEPVIPPCADVVCVLANLDAIGRPLDERIAHRVDRVAQLTHTMPGSIITAPLLVELLAHPGGGLKGIPPGARKVAVLTQQGETTPHPDAAQIMQTLIERGFDRAVTTAPRAAQPVLAEATS
jgi:molybdenum cofactor cytidylyltransferase